MIPKIIHYCWLSNDPIPEDLSRYMKTWKQKLPDYEFMLWDFNRFDKNNSQWVKEAFEHKKYAFAADYIRLYALYYYGGIYLDMDVEVLKTFTPFLSLRTMIGFENGNHGLEMATLGTEIQTPWIKACLQYYEGRSFMKKDGTLDTTTLPYIIFNTCKKNGYQLVLVNSIEEAHKYQSNDIIPVFTSDFFSPKQSFKSDKINIATNTVSIHHFAGTWLPWYSRLEKKICNLLGVESGDYIRRSIYKLQIERNKLSNKK